MRLKRIVGGLLVLLMILTLLPAAGLAAQPVEGMFSDLTPGGWYEESIYTLAGEGLVSGYPDGTFRPDRQVSVAEFITMTVLAMEYPLPVASGPWYAPYLEAARTRRLVLAGEFGSYDRAITRGEAARILYRALQLNVTNATDFIPSIADYHILTSAQKSLALQVYGAGILTGYPDRTIRFESTIRRSEAASLIHKIVDPSRIILPEAVSSWEGRLFSARGVTLGMTRSALIRLLGDPVRTGNGQWGGQWYTYHDSYRNFLMVEVRDGLVSALYSNVTLNAPAALQPGTRYRGTPSGARSLYQDETMDILRMADGGTALEVTVYLDHLDGDRINALMVRLPTYEPPVFSEQVIRAMEYDLLDVLNAERVKRGTGILTWSDGASRAALLHLQDMADRDYFAHNSPEGTTPGDRMSAQGIRWRISGENLAGGQRNVFEAHNAFLNSPGHRDVMLDSRFRHLGTAVHITTQGYLYYYGQNFYTH